jgi:hypothetical protein
LPIYQKETLANTLAIASIDTHDIPDVKLLNSQDESSNINFRGRVETRFLSSEASSDSEAYEQNGVSNQNRVKFQAAAEQRMGVLEEAKTEQKRRHHLKRVMGLKPAGKDSYAVKGALKESMTGEGTGYELINRVKE